MRVKHMKKKSIDVCNDGTVLRKRKTKKERKREREKEREMVRMV